jgi:hypothetical protein
MSMPRIVLTLRPEVFFPTAARCWPIRNRGSQWQEVPLAAGPAGICQGAMCALTFRPVPYEPCLAFGA